MTSGSLSLSLYHKIHYLRLGFRPVEIMKELQVDDQLCPSLTLIEYKDEAENRKQRQSLPGGDVATAEVVMVIDRSHLEPPVQISVVRIPLLSPWSVELPNQIEEMVRASIYYNCI